MKFIILEDVIDDVPGPVNKILRLFHTKVAAKFSVILNSILAEESIKKNKYQLDILNVLFECFQVSVAAKNTLTKCSGAHAVLKDVETQLDHLLSSFEELSSRSGLSVKSKRKTWIDVQANKARVSETRLAAMESLQAVENDCAKIKAAMLW